MTIVQPTSAGVITSYLWTVIGVCFLSNVLAGTTSTLMSVYLPVVVDDLVGQVNELRLTEVSSYINTLYFIGWAFGGFFWGWMGDRIGRSRAFGLSVVMFGLFTALTSTAGSWEMVMVFRFFSGFGVGGTLVLNTTLVAEVWPEKTKAIFIGILSIGFPVGIFSSGAVNYFIEGWRLGFLSGLAPLALGFLSLILIKESEEWRIGKTISSAGPIIKPAHNIRPDLISGSILFGTMLIGLWAVFAWTPTWVQSLTGSADSQHERGLSMMVMGASALVGGFFSGWISQALGIRKSMLICFAGCFLLSFLVFKLNSTFSPLVVIELGLLSILFGISQGLLSVYIPLLFPVSVRATATGFCFNVGRFFTAAAVFFVGTLVAVLGSYGNSLFVFSFVFLLGFVILFFSNKKREA